MGELANFTTATAATNSLNWLFNLHNPFVDGATAMIQNPFQSGFLVAINASPADACAGHGSPPINVSKCFADNA